MYLFARVCVLYKYKLNINKSNRQYQIIDTKLLLIITNCRTHELNKMGTENHLCGIRDIHFDLVKVDLFLLYSLLF